MATKTLHVVVGRCGQYSHGGGHVWLAAACHTEAAALAKARQLQEWARDNGKAWSRWAKRQLPPHEDFTPVDPQYALGDTENYYAEYEVLPVQVEP